MAYNTAWNGSRPSTAALGIDGTTSHLLRHQFASECLDDGMNIVDLSAVLGHADPSVTLRIYVNSRELHQAGEKHADQQVTDCRNSVPRVLMPAL